jgi:hypothetical protein
VMVTPRFPLPPRWTFNGLGATLAMLKPPPPTGVGVAVPQALREITRAAIQTTILTGFTVDLPLEPVQRLEARVQRRALLERNA